MWLKWTEKLAASLRCLAVESKYCSRLRSTLSSCQRCLEVCPTSSISWREGELILGRCLDCGLCASVCPTEALRLQQPSEPQLFSQLREVGTSRGEALLACERQVKLSSMPQALTVPCLGAISLELLLLIRVTGVKVRFPWQEETCQGCPVTGGIDVFRQRCSRIPELVATKTSLLSEETLNLDKDDVQARTGDHTQWWWMLDSRKTIPGFSSRRELFQATAASLSQLPLALFSDTLNDLLRNKTEGKYNIMAPGQPARITSKKQLYLAAVEKLGKPPFGLFSLPEGRQACFFCGACSNLCPTGALQQAEEGVIASLRLDSRRCSSCGLCVEVCSYRSLSLEPSTGVIIEGAVTLAQGIRQTCGECHRDFFAVTPASCCAACTRKQTFLTGLAGLGAEILAAGYFSD